jgi:hypothetical protein
MIKKNKDRNQADNIVVINKLFVIEYSKEILFYLKNNFFMFTITLFLFKSHKMT